MLSDLKKHLYVDQYCRDQPVLLNYLVEHSQIDDGMLFTFLWYFDICSRILETIIQNLFKMEIGLILLEGV